MKIWWPLLGLNQRPSDYESPALTTELRGQRSGDYKVSRWGDPALLNRLVKIPAITESLISQQKITQPWQMRAISAQRWRVFETRLAAALSQGCPGSAIARGGLIQRDKRQDGAARLLKALPQAHIFYRRNGDRFTVIQTAQRCGD